MSTPTTTVDPATAIKGWMTSLEAPDPEPAAAPAAAPPKEPDGQTSPRQPAVDAVPKPAAPAPAATPATPAATSTKPAEPVKAADADGDEKWPRTSQDWKKFKEARKKEVQEREEKIASLTKELEGVRQKMSDAPAKSPELESLTKERDELSDRLRLLDVERHPRFQAYFENKRNSQIELAKRIVGNESAEAVAKLLQQPDSDYKATQIEELMLNLTPLQQARIGSVLNSMAEIEAERQSEIAKAHENYAELARQREEAQKQHVAGVEKAFNEAALKAQENPIFAKKEGDSEWNKGVEQRLELARNLFFGKNVDSARVIQATLDAAAYPLVLQQCEALFAENEKLKGQVAAMGSASPALKSTAKTDATEGPSPVPIKVGMRPQEATAAWMKSITAE